MILKISIFDRPANFVEISDRVGERVHVLLLQTQQDVLNLSVILGLRRFLMEIGMICN